MSHENEQPLPFLLPAQPGLQDQGACLGAKNAISAFLQGRHVPGPAGDFYTVSFVCPYVAVFKKEAEAVLKAAFLAKWQGDISVWDTINVDTEKMVVRAKFYESACEYARGLPIAEQKVHLWENVVGPLFHGSGFQELGNPDSPWISFPSDYCEPQRIASRLGYTINLYDETHSYDAWNRALADVLDNTFGAPEEIQRWYDEKVAPAIEVLKEVRDTAAAAGAGVIAAAKRPSMLIPFIVVGGAMWYWLSKKRLARK